jgi:hypothetical protein
MYKANMSTISLTTTGYISEKCKSIGIALLHQYGAVWKANNLATYYYNINLVEIITIPLDPPPTQEDS